MPQFVVMRVSEIPALDQPVAGTLVRVSAVDAPAAVKGAAEILQEDGTNIVWGVTPQGQVTRFTSTPTAVPDWTVTQG